MTSTLSLLLSSLCGLAHAETQEPTCHDAVVAFAPYKNATGVPVDVSPAATVYSDCDREFTLTVATARGDTVVQQRLEPNDAGFMRMDLGLELEPESVYRFSVRGGEMGLERIGFTTGQGLVGGAPKPPGISQVRLEQPVCEESLEWDTPSFEVTVQVGLDPDGLATVALVESADSEQIHGPYIAGERAELVIPVPGYTSLTAGDEKCVQAIQYDGRGREVGRSEVTCGVVQEVEHACEQDSLGCGGCASGSPARHPVLGVVLVVLLAGLSRRRGRAIQKPE